MHAETHAGRFIETETLHVGSREPRRPPRPTGPGAALKESNQRANTLSADGAMFIWRQRFDCQVILRFKIHRKSDSNRIYGKLCGNVE